MRSNETEASSSLSSTADCVQEYNGPHQVEARVVDSPNPAEAFCTLEVRSACLMIARNKPVCLRKLASQPGYRQAKLCRLHTQDWSVTFQGEMRFLVPNPLVKPGVTALQLQS